MATAIDPTIRQPFDSESSDRLIAGGAWRKVALVVLVSLLACTVGAWLGYQQHVSPSSGASPVPAATAGNGKTAPSIDGLTRGLGENEEIVVDSAPTARPSGLPWPMWEFRLRQPIPPRDPSLTPPTWRLVGSALTSGKWAVIVLRQGSTTPEYFTVGQELPGGYRIESINDEDVTLAQGKRSMVLSYIGSR
ncbi:MAG: hypothetical protein ABI564_14965 [Ideonella sp.]